MDKLQQAVRGMSLSLQGKTLKIVLDKRSQKAY